VKGGSGTTVVASSLAMLAARSDPGGAALLDLAGEAPMALGVADRSGPGVAEWLGTDARSPASLARLVVEAGRGLRVVPRGSGGLPGDESAVASLFAAMAEIGGAWVVDAGIATGALAAEVVRAADSSLLVLRPCYLALQRALRRELPAHGLVLLRERGRALQASDIGAVLGLPVRAEVDIDPAVARAVDAGLLAGRLPRPLERSLRGAA
jgi:hypothetical protein